jgi:hypothetical protein
MKLYLLLLKLIRSIIKYNDNIKLLHSNKNKFWYLSAIEIIDTQVARRGHQYHRNDIQK